METRRNRLFGEGGNNFRPLAVYTVNGMKMFPRTIACRSNAMCNLLINSMLWQVSAASRLGQMYGFIAFPVYTESH